MATTSCCAAVAGALAPPLDAALQALDPPWIAPPPNFSLLANETGAAGPSRVDPRFARLGASNFSGGEPSNRTFWDLRAAPVRKAAGQGRHTQALIDYVRGADVAPDTSTHPFYACGQKDLDVLMDTVESQLTMCCRRGICQDTQGWALWGRYSCKDFENYGVCAAGKFTRRYKWLYRWSWYYSNPDGNCCACGKTERKSEAFDCGVEERKYCADVRSRARLLAP